MTGHAPATGTGGAAARDGGRATGRSTGTGPEAAGHGAAAPATPAVGQRPVLHRAVDRPTVAGPALLGRGAIVRPGQHPPSWVGDAPRFVVDARVVADPGTTVDRLHRRWVARQPYVVELAVDPRELQTPTSSTAPVHSHDPRFLFGLDRLAYLVWANTVDCRGDEPTWWHTVKATRALPSLTAGGHADVTLPDGRPAWTDGGPREPLDLDAVVLHRDDTERGRMALPTNRPLAPTRGLAPDQAAAVTAPGGAVRVAAPAGSGKTRVLSARIEEVLGVRGVPADSVLVLAYNTKAAAELRERCPVPGARVATVHAHALGLLRRHLGDVEVLGDRDVRRILSGLVEVPRRANVDPMQAWIDALERVRIAMVAPEEVEKDHDEVEGLAEVFLAYRDQLARRNAVDFPEMVHRAIELLLTDPAVRAAEQDRVGQVLVDEFQDLTPAYLLYIRLLASPQLQCFGVGDDDQVIYGHAGATPSYLLHFDTLFPGATDHPLTVNYRCPAPVVEGAVQLLGNNKVRLDKAIRARDGAPDEPITVHRLDRHAEARTVGETVQGWLDDDVDPTDIAVLGRVRVALLGTQAELSTRGIACRSPIGEWLLARTGVRAALAYLRLASDDHLSGEDLAEVLHRPLRPIPGSMKDPLRRRTWTVESLGRFVDGLDGGGPRRALQDFVRDIEVLRRRALRQPTAEVLRYITDVVGLGDVAESLDHHAVAGGGAAGASHIDDLQALIQVADHCTDAARFPQFLADVVAQPDPDGPAVTLSTIHSVKGLEWPKVVVVGAAEGISPHRLATGSAELEEERRVFHVAITRASQQLVVVAPTTGTSRFVAEMEGRPALVGRSAAPRPSAGAVTTRKARTPVRKAGRTTSSTPRYRASVGLEVKAPGGLAGAIESVTEEGALIRTARGSLLRLKYGSEVRVDGTLGTLVSP